MANDQSICREGKSEGAAKNWNQEQGGQAPAAEDERRVEGLNGIFGVPRPSSKKMFLPKILASQEKNNSEKKVLATAV